MLDGFEGGGEGSSDQINTKDLNEGITPPNKIGPEYGQDSINKGNPKAANPNENFNSSPKDPFPKIVEPNIKPDTPNSGSGGMAVELPKPVPQAPTNAVGRVK